MSYFKDKFLSKSFQESVWNLIATIFFIYLTGGGILLTTWLNTNEWEWTILVITTVVSVIPVVKNWISRNANIQIDELRAESQDAMKAASEDREKLNAEWQKKYDALKSEKDANEVKIHILEYDLEQAKKKV